MAAAPFSSQGGSRQKVGDQSRLEQEEEEAEACAALLSKSQRTKHRRMKAKEKFDAEKEDSKNEKKEEIEKVARHREYMANLVLKKFNLAKVGEEDDEEDDEQMLYPDGRINVRGWLMLQRLRLEYDHFLGAVLDWKQMVKEHNVGLQAEQAKRKGKKKKDQKFEESDFGCGCSSFEVGGKEEGEGGEEELFTVSDGEGGSVTYQNFEAYLAEVIGSESESEKSKVE